MEPIGPEQMARLEASVRRDEGAAEFPALAEALRRTGRPEAAEEVARRGLASRPDSAEGCLVLSLALLDQGRLAEAHQELAARTGDLLRTLGCDPSARFEAFAEVEFDGVVSEGELDQAFAAAAPDPDQLIDADRVAQEAMRAARLDEPESVAPETTDPIFATHTMAELLERQGDVTGAARVRAVIRPRTIDPWPRARREGVIETLEDWLENLRRTDR